MLIRCGEEGGRKERVWGGRECLGREERVCGEGRGFVGREERMYEERVCGGREMRVVYVIVCLVLLCVGACLPG